MRLFMDCSQTLVYGMFDLKGPTPIQPVVDAVKIFAGRFPEAEIVVWTFGVERDAETVAKLCFPGVDITCLKKDYTAPETGDVVVDDDSAYWEEMEGIKFFFPDDFVRAVNFDDAILRSGIK